MFATGVVVFKGNTIKRRFSEDKSIAIMFVTGGVVFSKSNTIKRRFSEDGSIFIMFATGDGLRAIPSNVDSMKINQSQ